MLCRAFVLAGLLGPAASTYVSGSFHLDAGDFEHGPEFEIAKYSFNRGKAHVSGKVRFKTADSNWMTSPALYLFNDDKWDEYHSAPACEDKVEHAHSVIQIGKLNNAPAQYNGRGGRGRQIGIPQAAADNAKNVQTHIEKKDDESIWHFTWEVEEHEKPHGWFLIAADCALEQYNAKVSRMDFEVNLLNVDDSHLPADEKYLPTLYLLVWVGLMAYGAYSVVLLKGHHAQTRSKIHLVVKLFMVAYALQLLATFCEMLHLWRFMSNGVGFFFFDFLSELSEGLSSLVISFVLICLACGWTLVESEANDKSGNAVATMLKDPRKLFKGPKIGILLVIIIVIGNSALVFINKGSDGDFSKFHDYETSAGRTLVMIRLFLGSAFFVSLLMTLRAQQSRASSEALSGFLMKLLAAGTIWFLCFPCLVAVASLLVHYLRHRVVAGGTLLTQSVCLIVLSTQFMSETSTYSRLSTAWESGLLPGLGGMVDAEKGEVAKD